MKKIFVLLIFCFLNAQNNEIDSERFADYQISSEKYFTDNAGNIKMFVNVWGHVNKPGLHEVYDGIDLATLFSLVGGPRQGANLRNVRIYRESSKDNSKMIHKINLDKFFQTGDRSNFIKVKPNDTIVVPQKFSNYLLGQVGTVNTFLSILNLYLQIERLN